MFSITENAAKQIHVAAKESNIETLVLRIAAKINQDGSIEYGMGFDEIKDGDTKIPYGDIDIVIDLASKDALDDASMDYVELEPGQFDFIFMNPIDPTYVPPKKDKKSK
ncbi:MAG: iron-sulfur cluster assembly accessory protein [Gammaproteobacteria bacterium]|nr:iron-sulfur cluster assembly accessory protein [Gammaproteobacteria bacterium]MCK5092123.1 iron-sulfur cluster assembly accessory protein [Gammaproteobacteria bacterium]